MRRYIDFAAANGIPAVLVEGWNVGWDGNWLGNGKDMDFSRPTEDFDADALAAYAKSKGVTLIGHHETGGSASHYDAQLDSAFKWAADHGERVVKTGLRRTYPNWVAREGGRGMEYNAWIGGKNPPDHEANLVFTQLLGGPMDFTPGVLSLTGSGSSAIQSTMAKQLATDWSDTRVLNGEVGDYVTIARKAKGSDDWYLGAVGDEEARSSQVKLDFLDAGRRYVAEIYRDGPGADYRTEARHAILIQKKPVKKGDLLNIDLAPGGGEAIRFVASGGKAKH